MSRYVAAATERLVAEARAMAKLSHANVVAVYDVEALATGAVILVMEYLPGQTLQARLQEERRDWRAVAELSATANVLAEADATVVQKAHELTGGLRPLSRCADTKALTADVEPPGPANAGAMHLTC